MRDLQELANRNIDGDSFPLLFAKKICVASGLWEKLEERDPTKRYYQNEKLKNFQQMSITCNFKDSLIAYHGDFLTDDFLAGLEVIQKATKAWLKGEVVGVLMRKISDRKIANKDFAASIAIIMDQLQNGESDQNSEKTQKTKELVIRMSNMQDIKQIGNE